MLRSLVIFMVGVYVGQEYGSSIPSVKEKSYEMFEQFRTTDLYKKICEDVRKK
jgi:hypothetical protein